MGSSFDLSILFNVVDRASKKFDRIGRSIDKMNSKIKKSVARTKSLSQAFTKAGKKMVSVGKTMTTRLTAPIVAFGALAIRTATGFQSAMNRVSAVTGATSGDLKKLEDRAKEMGATTQFSAKESADAMTFLAMAGLDTQQVYDALPGALQLAAAGGLELAEAADIATNVMSSMSMGVKDLSHINDVLAVAQSKSNTDVRQLAEAMKPAATTADSLGVSLESMTAMLGKMADAGERGSLAGTLLRNAMLAVAAPTNKQAQAFERMGVDISKYVDSSTGKLKDFTGLVQEVEKSGAKVSDVYSAFGQRGARAILTLTKKGKDLKEFTSLLENSEGAAQKASDEMMKGLPGAMKLLASSFEALQLAIVDSGLGKFIEDLIRGLAGFLQSLSELDPKLLSIVTTIAGVLAVAGPILIVLGQLAISIGALIPVFSALGPLIIGFGSAFKVALLSGGPMLWVIVGIATAAILLIKYWKPIKKWFLEIFQRIKIALFGSEEGFQKFLNKVKFVISKIIAFFVGYFNFFKKIVLYIIGLVKKVLSWSPLETLKKAWGAVVSFFSDLWNKVLDMMPDFLKKGLNIKAGGEIKVDKARQLPDSEHRSTIALSVKAEPGSKASITKAKSEGSGTRVNTTLTNSMVGASL